MNNMPIGGSANVPPGVALWGPAYKRWLHESADSVGGLGAQMETLQLPWRTSSISIQSRRMTSAFLYRA